MVWNNNDWRDVFPVKKGVENLIMAVPEWFILLRTDKKFRCPTCYDPANGESKLIWCQECWNSTYRVTPIGIPGRLEYADSNAEGDMNKAGGIYDRGYDTLHTIMKAYPNKQDRILQVGWNVPNKSLPDNPSAVPLKLLKVYEIFDIYYPNQKIYSWTKLVTTRINESFHNYENNLFRLSDIEFIKP